MGKSSVELSAQYIFPTTQVISKHNKLFERVFKSQFCVKKLNLWTELSDQKRKNQKFVYIKYTKFLLTNWYFISKVVHYKQR